MQPFDGLDGPACEAEKRALFDFAAFTPGFAQKDSRRRARLGTVSMSMEHRCGASCRSRILARCHDCLFRPERQAAIRRIEPAFRRRARRAADRPRRPAVGRQQNNSRPKGQTVLGLPRSHQAFEFGPLGVGQNDRRRLMDAMHRNLELRLAHQ